MRIKICGITQKEQAESIINLGVTTLGFICVPESPRYILPSAIKEIIEYLPLNKFYIGVFANTSLEQIRETVNIARLTGVQLHGQESPEFCSKLKKELPQIELIKALRIKDQQTLTSVTSYYPVVDTLLLDAYHPQLLGGSGHTINWVELQTFSPTLPWLLAGGLNPDNVRIALSQITPSGIDLSSGVEKAPGDKDIAKVKRLLEKLDQSPSL